MKTPPPIQRQNDGWRYEELIGPQQAGQQLLSYLSQHYPHTSAQDWSERIAAGQVRLNGRTASDQSLLVSGMQLSWQRPPWIEPEAPCYFALIYEDAALLAVNKPAGLPTLPGAGFLQATLLHLVQQHTPDAVPLHRLGRWTSGLVLCAKTTDARRNLLRQWSARQVGKRYRALISGTPGWQRLVIETPIGPVPHPLLGTIHAASPDGKPALSEVSVLERRGDCSLCDVLISTGRPHQIRIHLASVGHPLLGDPLYGNGGLPLNNTNALPGDPGYLLHAASLQFRHPDNDETIELQAPPPQQLVLPSDQTAVGADPSKRLARTSS